MTSVRLPHETAVFEYTGNTPMGGAPECFYSVTHFEDSGFAQALDNFHHAVVVEHTGDTVCDSRGGLTFAGRGKITKKCESHLTTNRRKSVAIKEKKRSQLVEGSKVIDGFFERQRL